jgi:signal transduction histidine kinase/DNA-binding response OmpR family regulator
MPNLLIVDDKSDNIYFLTALLSAHGYSVASARNGREALEYAKRLPPDLVIADLLMPVMDGYTLLRHWKADPALRRIGFIIYTATYTSTEDERLAHEMGVDAFVVKPTEPEVIISWVARILGRDERNAPVLPTEDPREDAPGAAMLGNYNASLVRKLEDKTIELRATNQSLRAEIEERSRLSNTRDAILDSLPAHIALVDHAGVILAVNNRWVSFAELNGGQRFQSSIGTNYLSICDQVVADGTAEVKVISDGIRGVLSGALPSFTTEYPCETPTEMMWFRIIVSPLEEPQINGAVVTHFNVTDVKMAEERNRKTTERLALALDAAAIGIWEWSPGMPLIWDNRMYDLYGIPRGEPVDFPRWSSRIHPDDVETADQVIARMAAAGDRHERQFRILSPEGTVRHIVETAKTIRRGRTVGITYVGTNVDITERHLMEEQLRQSQRLEAVGKMTGGIAHDFNNLLTVIMGNGEVLEGALDGMPHLQNLAEMIIQAADRGAMLSSQLLAFSRRQILAPRTINVDALLFRLEALLKRAVGGKIEIEIRSAPDLWTALIDPPELENALLNLCVNARDAMPGGGKLTIQSRNVLLEEKDPLRPAETRSAEYVLISVADNGTGMDENTRLRAFDPFFTTKDVGKGSGLGLSMVYGFVRQSRGHVKLQSALGQGTVVELYLPRSDGIETPVVEAKDAVPLPGGDETILVVEDDDALRAQVSAQLGGFGYRVLLAKDGLDALEILETQAHCDLLFTDMIMPRGMSGQQLASAARGLRPGLAVLFTSGFTEETMSGPGGLPDESSILRKPYRSNKLAEIIRAALDARR